MRDVLFPASRGEEKRRLGSGVGRDRARWLIVLGFFFLPGSAGLSMQCSVPVVCFSLLYRGEVKSIKSPDSPTGTEPSASPRLPEKLSARTEMDSPHDNFDKRPSSGLPWGAERAS